VNTVSSFIGDHKHLLFKSIFSLLCSKRIQGINIGFKIPIKSQYSEILVIMSASWKYPAAIAEWALFLYQQLLGYVNLGKTLGFSEPDFPHQ
jgi:hypothetical protein